MLLAHGITKVDQLHANRQVDLSTGHRRGFAPAQQYILRLQVGVDDAILPQELEAGDELDADFSDVV